MARVLRLAVVRRLARLQRVSDCSIWQYTEVALNVDKLPVLI